MTSAHITIRRCLLITATFCAVAIGSRVLAGETTQPPRPHSLIHRQTPEVMPADAGTSTTPPRSTAGAPAARSPQRKLTKRPAQSPMSGPSNETATSQPTASFQQPAPSLPTQRNGTQSKISMTAMGLAQPGVSSPSTYATTNAGTTSAVSSVGAATLSPKTPVAAAVPGMGPGPTGSRGAATGRGLKSLTAQMPGLTQLVAPTVTVSSPPPASQPSPSSVPPATQSTQPSSPQPSAGTATLSWTLNSETDLAGYKIYVGTASGLYNYPGSPFVAGVTSSYMIAGLPSGHTYYFAISAFDYSGSESGLSAEVSKSIH